VEGGVELLRRQVEFLAGEASMLDLGRGGHDPRLGRLRMHNAEGSTAAILWTVSG
jgi:hypothetical protein